MDSTRRHPNVVHPREITPVERVSGRRMALKGFPLAMNAGAKQLGATLYEIQPGQVPFPRHYHCANEEAMYVLEGTARVKIGDATIDATAGDFISFPVGPAHAHQVENSGTTVLRFLALSTMHATEVVGYPDSKKIMATGAPAGATWADPKWVRKIFEEGAEVDYFKGENVD